MDADFEFGTALSRELLTLPGIEIIRIAVDESTFEEITGDFYRAIDEAALTVFLASPMFTSSPVIEHMLYPFLRDGSKSRERFLSVSFGTSLPLRLAVFPSVDVQGLSVYDAIRVVSSSVARFLTRFKVQVEERKEVQARVEARIDEYVIPVLSDLRKRAGRYQSTAYGSYIIALATLGGGFIYAWKRAISSPSLAMTWQLIVQHVITNIIVIALLGAVARLAFVLGKSFMVESLRNTDRIHAISYGQFYLRAFGEKADWSEIKEAFQHWNIDKGSSFINQSASDVDPQVIQIVSDLIKTVGTRAKDTKDLLKKD